jgi:glutamine amidotransferase
MQWLYQGSEEAPDLPGLGLLSGTCRRLRPDGSDARVKVPHVGWNTLSRMGEGSIVEAVPDGAQVYFTHSYVAPVTPHTLAATEHGEVFAAVVQRGQVAGVQFHPEKSGDVGLQVLRNFRQMVG